MPPVVVGVGELICALETDGRANHAFDSMVRFLLLFVQPLSLLVPSNLGSYVQNAAQLFQKVRLVVVGHYQIIRAALKPSL